MQIIKIDTLAKEIVRALENENKGKSSKHLPKYREQALNGIFSALCDGSLKSYFRINPNLEAYLMLPKKAWEGKNRSNYLFYEDNEYDNDGTFYINIKISTAKLFLKEEFTTFEEWILKAEENPLNLEKIPHLIHFFKDLYAKYEENKDIIPLRTRWLELSAYLRRSKNISLVIYFDKDEAYKYLLSEGQLSVMKSHGNARAFSSEFWYDLIKQLPIETINEARDRTVDNIYSHFKKHNQLTQEQKPIQKTDIQTIIDKIWENGSFHEKNEYYKENQKKLKKP